ncbi:UNVERIFIED_CONTAM: hypothetical protein Sangu_3048400 [Sesamum angustifolium]|uniref:Uncharacterized protein n=1 Tax=Sesamum angustifolium TaxID=2727405 RepID=A0AAW2KFF8_9LAMI
MPFLTAIGADIVCPRLLLSTHPLLSLAHSHWSNGSALSVFCYDEVFAFALPFFLFQRPALLPFALEVEASPINTNSVDFLIVASYCTNILINSLIDFSSPFILKLTMNGS